MATLEKVMQMKQQGMTESEIFQNLKEEGLSPKEINDSLSQSKIKSALDFDESPQEETEPIPNEMQQSIMGSPESQNPSLAVPESFGYQFSEEEPVSETESQQQESETQQSQPQVAYQEYYPEYANETYPEYQPKQSVDIETINDMIEQSIEEKNAQLIKQITQFTRFREEMASELEIVKQRLERIENKFDELQIAILKKIGSYGEDIKDISREMHMNQESFSKMVDPLTENIQKLRKITGETSSSNEPPQQSQQNQPRVTRKSQKTQPDFEDYLR